MKILQQIKVESTTNNNFKATIAVAVNEKKSYEVIVKTSYKGKCNEFSNKYETYDDAFLDYIEDVATYSKHAALMNL